FKLKFDDVEKDEKDMAATQSHRHFNEFSIKKQMLASIAGGMVTAMALTPLDVVKTRLQNQPNVATAAAGTISNAASSSSHFSGTIDALIKISRNEGLHTLWRGLTPSFLMTIPSTAIHFTTYEYFKQHIERYTDKDNVYIAPLIAGSLGRVVSVTVTSPFELIRTNLQGITNRKTLHFVPLIREIVGNVGLTGLWRGLSPTLMRDVPFSAIYWSCYEIIKKKRASPFYINFVSGAMSGSIAAVVTTPIDLIKTRIQMTAQLTASKSNQNNSIISSSRNRTSAIYHAKEIYREEGLMGFTKGMVPRLAKVAPACAIMISTYEWVKSVNLDELAMSSI
ncbi:hypothetical protein SAMD00019534_051210, partial [Acytostelium subglobosum LB1]|uniref:hypothetical protein n=1 Tax=Acytostelium subglobosum LB1 TaxID=1410327 RepID=UPI000644D19C